MIGQDVRDLAVLIKKRRYAGPCQRAGWSFAPFITDTYGATSACSRSVIRKITQKYRQLHGDEQTYLFATKLHHQVAEASVARAAIALARAPTTPTEEQHPGIVTLPQPGAASSQREADGNDEDGADAAPLGCRVRVRFAGSGNTQRGETAVDPGGALQRTLFWEDKELGARVWTR